MKGVAITFVCSVDFIHSQGFSRITVNRDDLYRIDHTRLQGDPVDLLRIYIIAPATHRPPRFSLLKKDPHAQTLTAIFKELKCYP
jgi:hypothetical protein